MINKIVGIGMLLLLISVPLFGCEGNIMKNVTKAHVTDDDKILIRLTTTTPDDHSVTIGGYKFKEILEEKSDGKVEVQVFSNLQLGSLREQTEATQLGTNEMTLSLVSTASSFVEDLQVLEYPYLWPEDEEKLWNVVDEGIGEEVSELVSEDGFEGLGLYAGGYKVVTSKNQPIVSLDDFNDVAVRVIPSETLIATYKAWDAHPIPVDFAEVYNALQMGTVDAQENPLETTFTQKYYEVQNHLTELDHGYQFHMMLANKKWFDSLDSEIQEMIREADEEARKYARKINMESDEERLEQLEEEGLEIHEISDDERRKFKEVSQSTHEELSTTPGQKKLLQDIYDALEEKD